MKNNFKEKCQKSRSAEVKERKNNNKKVTRDKKDKRYVKNMLRSIVSCNDYESLIYDDEEI